MPDRLVDFLAAPLWWTEDDAEYGQFLPADPPPRPDSCPVLRSRPVPRAFLIYWWPHCQRLKGGGHCPQCGHDVTTLLPYDRQR